MSESYFVTTELFQANGTAERDAGLVMLEQIRGEHRVTVGADKGYDTRDFCRGRRWRSHDSTLTFLFGRTVGDVCRCNFERET
jgi:hypothetical protein